MNIIGEKVILRGIELSDKSVLLNIINDSETEHALGGWSFPISSFNQEEWIKNLRVNDEILRCMVTGKEHGETVGTVILSDIDYKNGNAEIHIKLLNDARGKGYGTDIINTIINYAFNELRLKCIYAHINEYNLASQSLFKKCGFEIEGVLRSRIYKKGEYHDVLILSITSEG